MAYIDGTAIRCGSDCGCGGHRHKLAEIHGTSIALEWKRGKSSHNQHQGTVSILELIRAVEFDGRGTYQS